MTELLNNHRFRKPRVLWKDLALLCGLFLLFRISGLLFFHPVFNDPCPWEEYYRGALARELLEGNFSSLWQFRPDNYGGGGLVMSVLAAVFFKFFGMSAFVLRLIAVLISLAALAVWFYLIGREISRRCAWYFSLLFIFAPPSFQVSSMISLGDHYETIFIASLAVWVFLDLKRTRTPALHSFLLGCLCAAGVCFNYIFSTVILALAALGVSRNPFFWKSKKFGWCCAGLAAGFLFWIIPNLMSGFAGLTMGDDPLWARFWPLPAWQDLRAFLLHNPLVHTLFLVFSYGEKAVRAPGWLIFSVYSILFLLPLTVLAFLRLQTLPGQERMLHKPKTEITAYFFIHGILHSAAILATGFEAARYLMPAMPSVFFLWSWTLTRLEAFSPRVGEACRRWFVLPMLGLGLLFWASMISPDYAGFLLKMPGYNYSFMTQTPYCQTHLESCFEQLLVKGDKERPNQRRQLSKALALEMAYKTLETPTPAFVREKSREFPDAYSAAIYHYYLGKVFYEHQWGTIHNAFAALPELIPFPESALGLAELGMFRELGSRDLGAAQFAARRIPEPYLPAYFRALGRQAARYWYENGVALDVIYQKIDESLPKNVAFTERVNFLKGIGGFAPRSLYKTPFLGMRDFKNAKDILFAEDQRYFYQGVGRAYEISYLFGPVGCETWYHQYFMGASDAQAQTWIEEGKEDIRNLLKRFEQDWTAEKARAGQNQEGKAHAA